jgi:predicted metalloprotease
MRWQGRRESDNVKKIDVVIPAPLGGGGGGSVPSGKGGIVLLIIVLVAGYYGVDLTGMLTGEPPAANHHPALHQPEEEKPRSSLGDPGGHRRYLGRHL